MIVPCECGAKLKIDDAKILDKGVKIRCPRCGTVLAARRKGAIPSELPVRRTDQPSTLKSTGPLVLVAYESDVIRSMISNILLEAGFKVEAVANGIEALKKANETKPHGMVLDVGLPGIYGFELCARLKADPHTKGIKIILVSSVYDNRRYKRTPESLYGADDFIEKHHIHDLPAKLSNHMFPEPPPVMPVKRRAPLNYDLPEMSRPPAREFEPSLLTPESLAQIGQGLQDFVPPTSTPNPQENPILPDTFSLEASIFQKEEYDIPQVDESDPYAIEKAKRFARIIVSDIALYNQETVIKGIQNGTFFELLKNDIQEGKGLYEKRVPHSLRRERDYYREAFDNFIAAAEKKYRERT